MPAKIKYNMGEIIGNNKIIQEDSEKTKQTGRGYWKCECISCGVIRSVRSDNLKQLCRTCAAKQRESNIIDDLTGKIFFEWRVLGKAKKPNYWICQCGICGTIREVFRGNLTQGVSKSCGCVKSWGEAQIIHLLDYWNFNYQREYSFKDLITDKGGYPRFDFAIFENDKLSYLIEYDGEQHFHYNNNWNMTEEEFNRLQEIDILKNNYCLNNNIPLYRFTKESNLEEEIKELALNTIRKGEKGNK